MVSISRQGWSCRSGWSWGVADAWFLELPSLTAKKSSITQPGNLTRLSPNGYRRMCTYRSLSLSLLYMCIYIYILKEFMTHAHPNSGVSACPSSLSLCMHMRMKFIRWPRIRGIRICVNILFVFFTYVLMRYYLWAVETLIVFG